MSLDLRASKVTENQNGTYLVAYQVFDTINPEKVIITIRVQGRTKAEITAELVRKYNKWQQRSDREDILLAIADEAAIDAKLIIQGS